jgi:uncharacterized alkaline shock family protein YloU
MVNAVGNSGPEIDGTLLATIASTAASGVLGVARLHDTLPERIIRSIRRSDAVGGVKMRRTPEGVQFDVNIVIEPDTDMVDLVRRVERDVTDAVRRVDNGASVEVKVHVRDVTDG